MKTNTVILEDGDNLLLVVRLGPRVSDPAGLLPALANVFRVVAQGACSGEKSILQLVPLGINYLASPRELDELEQREAAKRSN